MKRTRLVKLLHILSESEKALLQKHINHSDKDVHFKTIANYLLKHLHQATSLENVTIIKNCKVEITEKQLGTLSAQLFLFVENFMLNNWLDNLNENNREHLVQKEFLLLQYYKTKELPGNHKHISNLSQLIATKQKQISKHLGKKNASNVYHYYLAHRINYNQYYGLNESMLKDGENYIKATMANLDLFYSLAKLKFASEINFRNLLTNEKNEVLLLEEMKHHCATLAHRNTNDSTVQPLIEVYHLCSLLLTNPTENNLAHLKDAIIKYESNIDNSELSQLLTLAINYNTFISRQHNIDLSKTSYQLLSLGLKREIFNVNGLIRPDFLLNFAYLCSEFSDDQEIKSIMKQYKNRIPSNFKKATLNLCNAFICWHLKDYKKSIDYTQKKPKRTLFFFTQQKIIQIKCFYELSKKEQLNLKSDYIGNMLRERKSLKKYLHKKKGNFESIENLLNTILNLIDPNVTKKQMLEKIEQVNKPIAAKRWLLKKIEEK